MLMGKLLVLLLRMDLDLYEGKLLSLLLELLKLLLGVLVNLELSRGKLRVLDKLLTQQGQGKLALKRQNQMLIRLDLLIQGQLASTQSTESMAGSTDSTESTGTAASRSFEIVIQSLTFVVSEILMLMIVMWSIQLALIQLLRGNLRSKLLLLVVLMVHQ